MNWQIGCSGFHYKEWKEIFYPHKLAQAKWFGYYCQQFNALELNVTFYRFPQTGFLQNWYHKSPPGFCFAVKAPRLITHYKLFSEVEQLLADFYGTIKEGLQDKLGPVLFQLPGKAAFTPELLQRITESLDGNFNNVVEFRHNSWWQQQVYDKLAEHNITFCSISHPQLPADVIMNTNIVYYRFHGVPDLYKSLYSEDALLQVADTIKNNKKVRAGYAFFNNTAEGAAIQNARYLQEYCRIMSPVRH